MNRSATSQRWGALDRLHRHVDTRIEKQLYEELGVTTREYRALITLSQPVIPPQHHIRAVAKATGLSASATSRLLTRLHKRGMITVGTGRDRRTLDIQLTAKAHGLIRIGAPVLERSTAAAIASLDRSETDPYLLRFLEGW
ncbi:MarR family transcriptional regulator [Streptomyces sp. NPDC052309]|uniref:MarR family winged helix-turn-helix transcriptional regulator n=1 Tax=Streptomyces sp. NPDC052309 TaxID=3155421 RepID=UPI003427F277